MGLESVLVVGCVFYSKDEYNKADEIHTTLYKGKYYPLTEEGCVKLGYDYVQTEALKQPDEAFFTNLYTRCFREHGLNVIYSGNEAEAETGLTPEAMSKVAMQFVVHRQQIRCKGEQETVPVKVNETSKTALDKIDAFFQKVSFCGLVFKIRRVFVAVMLVGAVAAASRLKLKPMHPAVPIILGIGLSAMHYEPIKLDEPKKRDVPAEHPKKCDTPAEPIETKKPPQTVVEYVFNAKSIGSFSDADYATYIAEQTRGRWLALAQTILRDHQGMVKLEKKSYQISQCHGYSKWVYRHLSEIIDKPYLNAVMMKFPSYLEAIPADLRQDDPVVE